MPRLISDIDYDEEMDRPRTSTGPRQVQLIAKVVYYGNIGFLMVHQYIACARFGRENVNSRICPKHTFEVPPSEGGRDLGKIDRDAGEDRAELVPCMHTQAKCRSCICFMKNV